MKYFYTFVAVYILFFANVALASETNGTISSSSKYAWGENMGWINFSPDNNGAYYGLSVTDSSVTGYAWSPIMGWINFSPTNSGQGVSNTQNGHLSGSAWVARLGWLPMDGVIINSAGKFTGTAGLEGNNVGKVSFDCDYCNVITDWRPISARQSIDVVVQQTPINPNNGGGGNVALPVNQNNTSSSSLKVPPPLPSEILLKDKELQSVSNKILDKGGTVSITTSEGRKVEASFPAGTFDGTVTLTITPEAISEDNSPLPNVSAFLLGGLVFNITAKDQNGNFVHDLHKTITISIDIPPEFKDDKNLSAYYLNELNPKNIQWVLIPNTVFKDNKAYISVNHLTRFAIFRSLDHSDTLAVKLEAEHNLFWVWLIAAVFVIFLFLYRRKKKV